jgi:hypothetical protein
LSEQNFVIIVFKVKFRVKFILKYGEIVCMRRRIGVEIFNDCGKAFAGGTVFFIKFNCSGESV